MKRNNLFIPSIHDEVAIAQDEINKTLNDHIDAMSFSFSGRIWMTSTPEVSEFKQWLDKFKETHASL